MLFIPLVVPLCQAQGAFVSDDEINGIVDYQKLTDLRKLLEKKQIESAGQEDVLGDGNGNEDEECLKKQ